MDNAFADPIRESLAGLELPYPDDEANLAIGAGEWTWILELDTDMRRMRASQGTRLGSPPTWTPGEQWSRQGEGAWVEAVKLDSGWLNLEPLVLRLPIDSEHLGVGVELILAHVLVTHELGSWQATLGGQLDPRALDFAIYDALADGDPSACPSVAEILFQQFADVAPQGERCSRLSFGADLKLAPIVISGVEPISFPPSVCF